MAVILRFSSKFLHLWSVLLALIIPAILFPKPVAPQDRDNPLDGRLVENWTSGRELPSDFVNGLAQTPDGYLWIGTQRGLVRSDGLRHDTLLPDAVSDLCVGKDGALWICLADGVLRYQSGRFDPVPLKGRSTPAKIACILEDLKGDLWIGMNDGVLVRLKGGVVSEYRLPQNKEFSSITAVQEDARGTLWVGTLAGGLFKGRDGVFTRFDIGRTPDYAVFKIRTDRDGAIWAATNFGLIRIQDDRATILTPESGLAIGYVLDFLEDSRGNLWCSTPRGLHLIRRNGGGEYRAALVALANEVTDILFEDRERNLWISLPRFGLKGYKEVPFRTLAEESGVPSYTSAVLVSRDGTIWIGDDIGGLFRMKNGRAVQVLNLGSSPESGIMSMAEDSRGRLWVGTFRRGIFMVEAGRAVPYEAGSPLPAVRSILADSRGRMWFGFRNGLACLRDGAFVIRTAADGLPGNMIFCARESREGRIWIAADGGLAVLKSGDEKGGRFETVLSGETVLSLFEDEDGVLWAGTNGGGLLRIRNGVVTRCGRKEGLGSGIIHQISEDKAGFLWLSAPAGVIKVAKASWPADSGKTSETVEATVYGKSDGIRGESGTLLTGNRIARTPAGELWFALDNGISIVDPRKIEINRFLPTPILTRIRVAHQEIPRDRGDAAFKGARDVSFDFAAPSFISPERVKVRYRLDGVDSDWRPVEGSEEKAAEYKNLPFGAYRFRVAACNSDHVWNPAEAVFAFSLKPYFRQTWPFKAGMSILALIVGFLAFSGLQKTLELRKARRRYRHSTLDPDKAEKCAKSLIQLFEQEKIFTRPDLSLEALAKRLGVSPKDLSRIINERLHRNFWALVNSYRVEEARAKLDRADGGQTILDIALESGFNSLTAFNRAFKKFAGTTPSQYKTAGSGPKNGGPGEKSPD